MKTNALTWILGAACLLLTGFILLGSSGGRRPRGGECPHISDCYVWTGPRDIGRWDGLRLWTAGYDRGRRDGIRFDRHAR